MKYLLGFLMMMSAWTGLWGQVSRDTIGGEVSYTTSQNIYIRFASTKGIAAGDTLYMSDGGQLRPALIVKNTSSTSVVGSSISDHISIQKGSRIIAGIEKEKPREEIPEPVVIPSGVPEEVAAGEAEAESEEVKTPKIVPGVKGRISAASYINFSDQHLYDRQRMRYTFTLNANNIGKSRFSAESYISFRHTLNEWQEVKDHFNRAFKVYTLAIQYDINETARIWAGRKINFNISNIGAIDGLQFEKSWGELMTGIFAGSRPDHTEYNINPQLLQFGAYAGHQKQTKNGQIHSTLAFAEQRNHGMTDRRFAYFQHVNSAIKKVNLFTSFEFDLYTLVNNEPKNTFNISSIYFSLRYRVNDKLSLFGSYDARKNIIYYETYKNFIDQLLEDETRQGLRFSFTYRPVKYVMIGSSAGYRYQKDNPEDSKNLHSYLTWSRVPWLNASATVTSTLLQSPYLEGIIYGMRLSRDIIDGKLYGELEFRRVSYQYRNIEEPITQHLAGMNLTWRMTKKLSFAIYYEGEIRKNELSHRINTNIIQRF